jgi:hypothetical protein
MCGKGTYNGEQGQSNVTACLACPAGTYNAKEGAVNKLLDCEKCGNGKYSTHERATSEATCKECPQGKFLDALGADSDTLCEFCGAGTFSLEQGIETAAACPPCVPGYFCVGDNNIAVCADAATSLPGSNASTGCACLPGYAGDGLDCSACAPDHFCANGTQFACPANTSTYNASRATSAAACRCAPGFAPDAHGACAPCPADRVCEGTGLSAPCPSALHASAPGADSVDACECALPNTGSDGGTCVHCEAGKRASAPNSTTCQACPTNHFCMGGMTIQACPANSTAHEGSASNKSCVCQAGFARNESIRDAHQCIACQVPSKCPAPLSDAAYRVEFACADLAECWDDATFRQKLKLRTGANTTKVDAEDSAYTSVFRVPFVVTQPLTGQELGSIMSSGTLRSRVTLNATVSVRRARALCGSWSADDLLAHARQAVVDALLETASSDPLPVVSVDVTVLPGSGDVAVLNASVEYVSGTYPRQAAPGLQAFTLIGDLCAGTPRAITPMRPATPSPEWSRVAAPHVAIEHVDACASPPILPCYEHVGSASYLRVNASLDGVEDEVWLQQAGSDWVAWWPSLNEGVPVLDYTHIQHVPTPARPVWLSVPQYAHEFVVETPFGVVHEHKADLDLYFEPWIEDVASVQGASVERTQTASIVVEADAVSDSLIPTSDNVQLDTAGHITADRVALVYQSTPTCEQDDEFSQRDLLNNVCVCRIGYGRSPQTGKCDYCAAGTYRNRFNQTKCDECPKGHKCDGGATKVMCGSGTIAEAGASRCTQCPSGTVALTAGMHKCETCARRHKCPGGATQVDCGPKLVPNSHKSECVPCSPGQFISSDYTCTTCTEDMYCPCAANTTCAHEACPDNAISDSGASSLTDCMCSDGFSGVITGPDSTCTACPDGEACTVARVFVTEQTTTDLNAAQAACAAPNCTLAAVKQTVGVKQKFNLLDLDPNAPLEIPAVSDNALELMGRFAGVNGAPATVRRGNENATMQMTIAPGQYAAVLALLTQKFQRTSFTGWSDLQIQNASETGATGFTLTIPAFLPRDSRDGTLGEFMQIFREVVQAAGADAVTGLDLEVTSNIVYEYADGADVDPAVTAQAADIVLEVVERTDDMVITEASDAGFTVREEYASADAVPAGREFEEAIQTPITCPENAEPVSQQECRCLADFGRTDAGTCERCGARRYLPAPNTPCATCPVGFYCPPREEGRALRCPRNITSPPGAEHISACVCPLGFVGNYTHDCVVDATAPPGLVDPTLLVGSKLVKDYCLRGVSAAPGEDDAAAARAVLREQTSDAQLTAHAVYELEFARGLDASQNAGWWLHEAALLDRIKTEFRVPQSQDLAEILANTRTASAHVSVDHYWYAVQEVAGGLSFFAWLDTWFDAWRQNEPARETVLRRLESDSTKYEIALRTSVLRDSTDTTQTAVQDMQTRIAGLAQAWDDSSGSDIVADVQPPNASVTVRVVVAEPQALDTVQQKVADALSVVWPLPGAYQPRAASFCWRVQTSEDEHVLTAAFADAGVATALRGGLASAGEPEVASRPFVPEPEVTCAATEYKNSTGACVCLPGYGRTSAGCAVCAPGTVSRVAGGAPVQSETTCVPCPPAYYCPGGRDLIGCPSDATSTANARARGECVCRTGFAGNLSTDAECRRCAADEGFCGVQTETVTTWALAQEVGDLSDATVEERAGALGAILNYLDVPRADVQHVRYPLTVREPISASANPALVQSAFSGAEPGIASALDEHGLPGGAARVNVASRVLTFAAHVDLGALNSAAPQALVRESLEEYFGSAVPFDLLIAADGTVTVSVRMHELSHEAQAAIQAKMLRLGGAGEQPKIFGHDLQFEPNSIERYYETELVVERTGASVFMSEPEVRAAVLGLVQSADTGTGPDFELQGSPVQLVYGASAPAEPAIAARDELVADGAGFADVVKSTGLAPERITAVVYPITLTENIARGADFVSVLGDKTAFQDRVNAELDLPPGSPSTQMASRVLTFSAFFSMEAHLPAVMQQNITSFFGVDSEHVRVVVTSTGSITIETDLATLTPAARAAVLDKISRLNSDPPPPRLEISNTGAEVRTELRVARGATDEFRSEAQVAASVRAAATPPEGQPPQTEPHPLGLEYTAPRVSAEKRIDTVPDLAGSTAQARQIALENALQEIDVSPDALAAVVYAMSVEEQLRVPPAPLRDGSALADAIGAKLDEASGAPAAVVQSRTLQWNANVDLALVDRTDALSELRALLPYDVPFDLHIDPGTGDVRLDAELATLSEAQEALLLNAVAQLADMSTLAGVAVTQEGASIHTQVEVRRTAGSVFRSPHEIQKALEDTFDIDIQAEAVVMEYADAHATTSCDASVQGLGNLCDLLASGNAGSVQSSTTAVAALAPCPPNSQREDTEQCVCAPGFAGVQDFEAPEADFCVQCPAGSFTRASTFARTECLPCPAGSYCTGGMSVVACATDGSATSAPGTGEAAHCFCAPGYARDAETGVCAECAGGACAEQNVQVSETFTFADPASLADLEVTSGQQGELEDAFCVTPEPRDACGLAFGTDVTLAQSLPADCFQPGTLADKCRLPSVQELQSAVNLQIGAPDSADTVNVRAVSIDFTASFRGLQAYTDSDALVAAMVLAANREFAPNPSLPLCPELEIEITAPCLDVSAELQDGAGRVHIAVRAPPGYLENKESLLRSYAERVRQVTPSSDSGDVWKTSALSLGVDLNVQTPSYVPGADLDTALRQGLEPRTVPAINVTAVAVDVVYEASAVDVQRQAASGERSCYPFCAGESSAPVFGVLTPKTCPENTVAGPDADSLCACASGFAGPSVAKGEPSACAQCLPGTYTNASFADRTRCRACPGGFACPGGDTLEPCPQHASSLPGATDISECQCRNSFFEIQGVCQQCIGPQCSPTVWGAQPEFTIYAFKGLNDMKSQAERTGKILSIAARIREAYAATSVTLNILSYRTHVRGLVSHGPASTPLSEANVTFVASTDAYEALRSNLNRELEQPSSTGSVAVHAHEVRYVAAVDLTRRSRAELELLARSNVRMQDCVHAAQLLRVDVIGDGARKEIVVASNASLPGVNHAAVQACVQTAVTEANAVVKTLESDLGAQNIVFRFEQDLDLDVRTTYLLATTDVEQKLAAVLTASAGSQGQRRLLSTDSTVAVSALTFRFDVQGALDVLETDLGADSALRILVADVSQCEPVHTCAVDVRLASTPTSSPRDCPENTTMALDSSGDCVCSAGFAGPIFKPSNLDAAACELCTPGTTWHPREGNTGSVCQPCPENNYCPDPAGLPQQCPAGSTTQGTGAPSVDFCLCDDRFIRLNNSIECVPCSVAELECSAQEEARKNTAVVAKATFAVPKDVFLVDSSDVFGSLDVGDGKRVLALAYPMRTRAKASAGREVQGAVTPPIDVSGLQLDLNQRLELPESMSNLHVRAYALQFEGTVRDALHTPAEIQAMYEQQLLDLAPGAGSAWFSVSVAADTDPAQAHQRRRMNISLDLLYNFAANTGVLDDVTAFMHSLALPGHVSKERLHEVLDTVVRFEATTAPEDVSTPGDVQDELLDILMRGQPTNWVAPVDDVVQVELEFVVGSNALDTAVTSALSALRQALGDSEDSVQQQPGSSVSVAVQEKPPCPPNSAYASSAAVDCECDDGFARDAHGACAPCAPGQVWSEVDGTAVCTDCPAGKYCKVSTQDPQTCPQYSTSEPGADDASDCYCKTGYKQACTVVAGQTVCACTQCELTNDPCPRQQLEGSFAASFATVNNLLGRTQEQLRQHLDATANSDALIDVFKFLMQDNADVNGIDLYYGVGGVRYNATLSERLKIIEGTYFPAFMHPDNVRDKLETEVPATRGPMIPHAPTHEVVMTLRVQDTTRSRLAILSDIQSTKLQTLVPAVGTIANLHMQVNVQKVPNTPAGTYNAALVFDVAGLDQSNINALTDDLYTMQSDYASKLTQVRVFGDALHDVDVQMRTRVQVRQDAWLAPDDLLATLRAAVPDSTFYMPDLSASVDGLDLVYTYTYEAGSDKEISQAILDIVAADDVHFPRVSALITGSQTVLPQLTRVRIVSTECPEHATRQSGSCVCGPGFSGVLENAAAGHCTACEPNTYCPGDGTAVPCPPARYPPCDDDNEPPGCAVAAAQTFALTGTTPELTSVGGCTCPHPFYRTADNTCTGCPFAVNLTGAFVPLPEVIAVQTAADCRCPPHFYEDKPEHAPPRCTQCPLATTQRGVEVPLPMDASARLIGLEACQCPLRFYKQGGACVPCPMALDADDEPIELPATEAGIESVAQCKCPFGFYLDEEAHTCTLCPRAIDHDGNEVAHHEGTYTEHKNDVAQCKCPRDFFKNETGCHQCPRAPVALPLDWQNELGITRVEECRCPGGFFLADARCQACPAAVRDGAEVALPEDIALGITSVAGCKCPGGFYRDDAACVLCPAAVNASGDVVPLPETQAGLDDVMDCKCPQGFFQNTSGCHHCPAAMVNGRPLPPPTTIPDGITDISECECPSGFLLVGDACLSCPRAQTRDGLEVALPPMLPGITDIADCLCPAGFFLDAAAAECTQCPAAVDEWNRASTNIKVPLAPEGSNKVTDCACPQGFYLYEFEQTCVRCPQAVSAEGVRYALTSGPGLTRASQCTCPPGFYKASGTCKPCEENYFCDGQGARVACGSGKFSLALSQTRDACQCAPGFFADAKDADVCVRCFDCSETQRITFSVPRLNLEEEGQLDQKDTLIKFAQTANVEVGQIVKVEQRASFVYRKTMPSLKVSGVWTFSITDDLQRRMTDRKTGLENTRKVTCTPPSLELGYDASSRQQREAVQEFIAEVASMRGRRLLAAKPETATVFLGTVGDSVDLASLAASYLLNMDVNVTLVFNATVETDALINTQDFQEDLAEEFNDLMGESFRNAPSIDPADVLVKPIGDTSFTLEIRDADVQDLANTAKTNTAWRKQLEDLSGLLPDQPTQARIVSTTQPRTYQDTGGISAALCAVGASLHPVYKYRCVCAEDTECVPPQMNVTSGCTADMERQCLPIKRNGQTLLNLLMYSMFAVVFALFDLCLYLHCVRRRKRAYNLLQQTAPAVSAVCSDPNCACSNPYCKSRTQAWQMPTARQPARPPAPAYTYTPPPPPPAPPPPPPQPPVYPYAQPPQPPVYPYAQPPQPRTYAYAPPPPAPSNPYAQPPPQPLQPPPAPAYPYGPPPVQPLQPPPLPTYPYAPPR